MEDQSERCCSRIPNRRIIALCLCRSVFLNPERTRRTLLDLCGIVKQLGTRVAGFAIFLELRVINLLCRGEALQVVYQFCRPLACLMQDLRQRAWRVISNRRHYCITVQRWPAFQSGRSPVLVATERFTPVQNPRLIAEPAQSAFVPLLS